MKKVLFYKRIIVIIIRMVNFYMRLIFPSQFLVKMHYPNICYELSETRSFIKESLRV